MQEDKTSRPAAAAGKASEREDRLARALRENLRKRKQQARARDGGASGGGAGEGKA